jgi:type II secretory pathway component PulL
MQLALANIVREGNNMAQTGKQLRASLLTGAAKDYQDWERQRRFWQRVSITCAIIAVFFAGVAVGGAIS